MWHRSALAAILVLVAAMPAVAQVNNVYSRAIPPDKLALERLNLKIEWTANIPVEGRRDSLTQIQLVDDQIFVQTRTGLFIAGDALTGQLQWFVQLGNGDYANTYSVATNSQYVYVAHVTKLHCFHRYSGVVEYVTDLGSPPTTGLAADETGVYCPLGLRPGNSGGHRIAVYDLIRPIAISTPAGKPGDPNKPAPKDPKAINPVDRLITRYGENFARPNQPEIFDSPKAGRTLDVPTGGGNSGNRSPSLSALPRVTPPYTLENEVPTPSISMLPSLRQPYHLRNEFQRDIQRTASIGVIPPSLAASLALADLRPKNVGPPLRWEFGLTAQVLFPPFLTPTRVWLATDTQMVTALNKRDKKIEVVQKLADPISAMPGRGGLFVYVPIGSGFLVAIEGSTGSLTGGANIIWRAPVGGIANRTPYVTEKFVYSQGDNSGVVCVNRTNGDIIWRSEDLADRILGANEEFLYVRDHQGRLLIFDAKRPTNPATLRSMPLAALDLKEFNINIVNTASDRIYLAADNGLVICLRDMNPKYARPVRICPEVFVNAAAKGGVDTIRLPGMPPSPDDPKKDPADPKKN